MRRTRSAAALVVVATLVAGIAWFLLLGSLPSVNAAKSARKIPSIVPNNQAATAWAVAPVCCKKCPNPGCCCPNRGPVTRTIWQTKTATPVLRGAKRHLHLVEKQVSEQATDSGSARSAWKRSVEDYPSKRNNCPVCPNGVKLASAKNNGGSVKYCCPARSTVTKTRFKTIIPSVLISGQVWYDNDLTNKFTTPDKPLANTDLILLKPDGTVYAKVKSDANGNFLFVPKKGSPLISLKIAPASNPKQILGTFFTDQKGNGRVDAPLPPPKPVVAGKVWFDNNLDGKFGNTTDKPLPGETVLLKRPDGSVFATAVLDANGEFIYNPSKAEPRLKLTIERKKFPGRPLGTFILDNKGNGRVDVPLPPTKPTIAVKVWYDNDITGTFNAGDAPVPNKDVYLLNPDGTVYAKAVLNANGELIYNPPAGSPNTRFTCVACGILKARAVTTPQGSARFSCPYMKTLATIVTDSQGNGKSFTPIPPELPTVAGNIWYDNDMNGKAGDPLDVPMGGAKVNLLRPDGSIFATVITDSKGNFKYNPSTAEPNLNLTTVLASDPKKTPLMSFVTDSKGNGRMDLPIIPALPVVTGKIWLDGNKDQKFGSPYDSPLAGQTINLKRPDGTVFATVVADKNGEFVYLPPKGEPNLLLSAFLPGNPSPIARFTTDSRGNGRMDIPIPPNLPTISGKVWHDLDNNGIFGLGDTPLSGEVVQLKRPDGTILAEVNLDFAGEFVYNPKVAEPGVMLTVVRKSTGTSIGTLTLDSAGSGRVDIPIPVTPPSGVTTTKVAVGTTQPGGPTNTPVPATTNPAGTNTQAGATTNPAQGSTTNPVGVTTQTGVTTNPGNTQQTTPLATTAVANPSTSNPVAGTTTVGVTTTSQTQTPTPLAKIVGQIFYDLDSTGTNTAGDTPYANIPINLLYQNGTIYLSTTTDASGNFSFLVLDPSNIAPSVNFTVAKASNGYALGNVLTDAQGNGATSIPLPVALVTAKLFNDFDSNALYSSGETVIPSTSIVVKAPNGTVIKTLNTDANGTISFVAIPGFENMPLSFALASNQSKVLGIAFTSTTGAGHADLPIPEARLALVPSCAPTYTSLPAAPTVTIKTATVGPTPSSTPYTDSDQKGFNFVFHPDGIRAFNAQPEVQYQYLMCMTVGDGSSCNAGDYAFSIGGDSHTLSPTATRLIFNPLDPNEVLSVGARCYSGWNNCSVQALLRNIGSDLCFSPPTLTVVNLTSTSNGASGGYGNWDSSSHSGFGWGSLIGTKYYGYNAFSKGGASNVPINTNPSFNNAINSILCFDFATRQPCASSPIPVPTAGDLTNLAVFSQGDDKWAWTEFISGYLFVYLANYHDRDKSFITCLDTTRNFTICDGSWPVLIPLSITNGGSYYTPAAFFPYVPVAGGPARGICMGGVKESSATGATDGLPVCWDFSGRTIGMLNGTGGWAYTQEVKGAVLGNKFYTVTDSVNGASHGSYGGITCFDMSSNSTCSGYPIFLTQDNWEYSVTIRSPSCAVIASGPGKVAWFNPLTGQPGCGSGSSNSVPITFSAPPTSSTCKPSMVHWKSIVLTEATCNYSSASITVYGADGVTPVVSQSSFPAALPATINLDVWAPTFSAELDMAITGAVALCGGSAQYCPIKYEVVYEVVAKECCPYPVEVLEKTPAKITGKVFTDVNHDGNFTGGTDTPISGQIVQLKLADGTVVGSGLTGADGTFIASVPPNYPNTLIFASIPSNPSALVVPFTTDAGSNGNVLIPVGSPLITGVVFNDTLGTGVFGPSDALLPNQPVIIKLANGTTLATVTSDGSGLFRFIAPPGLANTPLFFALSSSPSQILGSVVTDNQASAFANVAVGTPVAIPACSLVAPTGAATRTFTSGAKTAAPPVPTTTLAAGSTGNDGWDVYFHPDGLRLLNYPHFNSYGRLQCLISDGSPCPCYNPDGSSCNTTSAVGGMSVPTAAGYYPLDGTSIASFASGLPNLAFSSTMLTPIVASPLNPNEVWHITTMTMTTFSTDYMPVVIGFDVGPTLCSSPKMLGPYNLTGVPGSANLIEGPGGIKNQGPFGNVLVGTKIYAYNAHQYSVPNNGSLNKLLCFDTATKSRCVGSPYNVTFPAGFQVGNTERVYTSYVEPYIFVSTVSKLNAIVVACVDPSNNYANCAGNFPVTVNPSIYGANYNYPGPAVQWVPVVGQAAKGFCTLGYKNPLVCYDFVGNQKVVNSATPAGIPEGEGKVVGSKYYIPSYSFGKISCYDMTTNGACAGYPRVVDSDSYTINVKSPTCFSTMSDAGDVIFFNPETGTLGCESHGGLPSFTETIKPGNASCRVTASWKSVTFTTVNCTVGAGSKFTLYDASKKKVTGFADITVPSTDSNTISVNFDSSVPYMDSLNFEVWMDLTANTAPSVCGLPANSCQFSYEAVYETKARQRRSSAARSRFSSG